MPRPFHFVHRSASTLFAVAAILVSTQVTYADDAEDAQAMFAAGIAALEQGNGNAARAAFERSLELHPTSAAAFNLAGVLRDLGRPMEAYRLYEELGRGVFGTLTAAQQAEVTRLSGESESALARIEVRVVAPGSVSITIGEEQGTALEGTPFVQFVDPGEHTVRGTTEGAPTVERNVSVRAGGLGRTLLRFEPIARPTGSTNAGVAGRLVDPDESAQRQDEGRRISPWLWVALGVLVAGGAATAIILATRDSGGSDDIGVVLPATGTLVSF